MKVDIVAFGVHPDDVELGCAGTLLKHASMGYTFGICDLTRGELGSRGSAELRSIEAENARQILGAQFRINLGMADGFFEINKENTLKICEVIRKYQPKIVIANSLSDRHPDHGRAAKLVTEACFYAGLIKIEVLDENGQSFPPWRPTALYHYIQDKNLKPDFCVDVSPFFEKKIEAVLAFSSQFKTKQDNEPQTPISTNQFYEFLYAKAKTYGRDINADYAEGFNVARIPGVQNLFDLF
jgi:N-acetylglucosamine malate deacetylase 1